MQRFFPKPCEKVQPVHSPTIQRVPVVTESGDTLIECIDVDTVDESLKLLSYTDFDIQRLIENGVDLKHLQITRSSGLGVDDSILDDFDSRLESISDQLFNN